MGYQYDIKLVLFTELDQEQVNMRRLFNSVRIW